MSYHLRLLQSLVRLSHSSGAPSRAALLARAGGTDSALGDALDLLVTLGLVQSHDPQQPLRLTLSGLAVGTAYAAEAARLRERDEAQAVEEPTRTGRAGAVRKAPRDRRATASAATARSVANRAA